MSQPLNPRTVGRIRTAAALLGFAFAAAIAGFVLFLPSGNRAALPPAIVAVTPADGAAVADDTVVEIELAPGVTAEVFLDGRLLDVGGTTGSLRWAPGPGERFERWPAGGHTVEVRYQDEAAGVYRFSFVVR